MNIGLISRGDIFPPFHGAAAKIYSTARNISLLGHPVYFISENRTHYHLFRDGSILTLPYPKRLHTLLFFPRVVKSVLRRIGIPEVDCFLYAGLLDFNFWLRTGYIARRHGLDIIQAEFPGYTVPALLVSALLRRRTALVEHNVEFLRIVDSSGIGPKVQRRLRWIEKLICAAVGDIITVSDVDRERLMAVGVPGRKIITIPHGVDLGAYARITGHGIREKYGVRPDEICLFFHGILNYGPNYQAVRTIAEEILPGLESRGVKAAALVVGRYAPPEFSHPRMICPGPVGDLSEHIRGADLGIVPLKGGGGIRMKILEYFAGELPVVSTDKGAEGIVVGQGQGMIVVDSVDALIEEVARLAKNPEERRAIGRRGYLVVSKMDWIELCLQYIERFQGAGRPPLPPAPAVHAPLSSAGYQAIEDAPGPAGKAARQTTLDPVSATFSLREQGAGTSGQATLVPTEQALDLIEALGRAGLRHIRFLGDDPLLHPEAMRIIERAAALGISPALITTRRLPDEFALSEHLRRSLRIEIPLARFARDGGVDNLRDRPAKFYGALRALLTLRGPTSEGAGSSAASPGPLSGPGRTAILSALNGFTVKECFGLFKLARRVGAGLRFKAVSRPTPASPPDRVEPLDPTQEEIFQDFLYFVERTGTEPPEVIQYYRSILAFYKGRLPIGPCRGLRSSFHITARLDVKPCERAGCTLITGDLGIAPIDEIWASPEAERARQALGATEEGGGTTEDVRTLGSACVGCPERCIVEPLSWA